MMKHKWLLMIYDSTIGDLPVVMDFDSAKDISKWITKNIHVAQTKWDNKSHVCSIYLPEKGEQ